MKKLCAVVIVFAAVVVGVAVWFSPLTACGTAYVYEDNRPIREISGCYSDNDVVRADCMGGEAELRKIFARLCAVTVKTEQAGDITVVYAVSPRVAATMQTTCDGTEYNVMAAYGNGRVAVGTPILQGCY